MTTPKRLKGFIDSAMYKNNTVHGVTVIDHKIRSALGLSNDEYVMASLIEKLTKDEKVFDYARVHDHIAFDKAKTDSTCDGLYEKKIILFDKELNRMTVTVVWTEAHKSQQDENFEKFYAQSYGKSWPGSKPMARQAYDQLVPKVGHEYLLMQKLAYFKFLALPINSFRNVMQASEFLNERNQRYAEDWNDYIKQVKDSPSRFGRGENDDEPVTPNTLTMEQRKKMYE